MKRFDRRSSARLYLGLELGSTRIKSVLTDEKHFPVASGSFEWENELRDGLWTYALEDVWRGIRGCFATLMDDYAQKYGALPDNLAAAGVSAMMHGYLAFDGSGELLAPFRTWRNANAADAAAALSERFSFNIPERWSVAHLYQAMLEHEAHLGRVSHITTLAGYVHSRLTGENVLGVGDASGMFPIDGATRDYDRGMLASFEALAKERGYSIDMRSLLPRILPAGAPAGSLTEEGARLLDPAGRIKAGVPFCPPEGDAGAGMVATNSVLPRTGNVSAGTSIFAMCVLERPLSGYYPEIDVVATPSGDPVAMVHCNNGSNEIDACVRLLGEAAEALGARFDTDRLYETLVSAALRADADCGGLLIYNYLSGEPVTGFAQGRPLFLRGPESRLTLPNLMRAELYSALATLRIGIDILTEREDVTLDAMTGHGGFFKVGSVGQTMLASALGVPVAVMETAGEGGPWGMAILASYMLVTGGREPLSRYIGRDVFSSADGRVREPSPEDEAGFQSFMKRYRAGLAVERAAIDAIK